MAGKYRVHFKCNRIADGLNAIEDMVADLLQGNTKLLDILERELPLKEEILFETEKERNTDYVRILQTLEDIRDLM